MKIVDRATFLAMPVGTVFSYHHLYEDVGVRYTPPGVLTGLNIKGETMMHDGGKLGVYGDYYVNELLSPDPVMEDDEAHYDAVSDERDKLYEGVNVPHDFKDYIRDADVFSKARFTILDPEEVDDIIAQLTEARSKMKGIHD
jgi:hypothetical protein